MTSSVDAERESYATRGYAVLPGLLDRQTTEFAATYVKVIAALGRMNDDAVIGDAISVYGDPAFDALLATLVPRIGAVAGEPVLPTYSFARVYFEGQELQPHRDRPSCEHSVTVHLSSSSPSDWPICFDTPDGSTVELSVNPGDGVAYRGIERAHWRGPCPVEWYAQVFLHFVTAAGPHRAHVLDGRDLLGSPPVPKEEGRAS